MANQSTPPSRTLPQKEGFNKALLRETNEMLCDRIYRPRCLIENKVQFIGGKRPVLNLICKQQRYEMK